MGSGAQLVSCLERICGSEHVLTHPHALATYRSDAIAAENAGCAAQLNLHLRELGHPLPIHHPIELLWRLISAGAGRASGASRL